MKPFYLNVWINHPLIQFLNTRAKTTKGIELYIIKKAKRNDDKKAIYLIKDNVDKHVHAINKFMIKKVLVDATKYTENRTLLMDDIKFPMQYASIRDKVLVTPDIYHFLKYHAVVMGIKIPVNSAFRPIGTLIYDELHYDYLLDYKGHQNGKCIDIDIYRLIEILNMGVKSESNREKAAKYIRSFYFSSPFSHEKHHFRSMITKENLEEWDHMLKMLYPEKYGDENV